jgi:(2Fe-2S) ferredoxin
MKTPSIKSVSQFRTACKHLSPDEVVFILNTYIYPNVHFDFTHKRVVNDVTIENRLVEDDISPTEEFEMQRKIKHYEIPNVDIRSGC